VFVRVQLNRYDHEEFDEVRAGLDAANKGETPAALEINGQQISFVKYQSTRAKLVVDGRELNERSYKSVFNSTEDKKADCALRPTPDAPRFSPAPASSTCALSDYECKVVERTGATFSAQPVGYTTDCLISNIAVSDEGNDKRCASSPAISRRHASQSQTLTGGVGISSSSLMTISKTSRRTS